MRSTAKNQPNRDAAVLVVDDDPAFGASVTDALSALGWRARYVGVSAEAAALVRDLEFDALVTDLRMPEVDGLALLSLAKQVAPERPVIVMTAFSALDSAVECVRQGAYHYLTKPFKVRELDLYLQRALEERALRRKTRELRRALHERYALGGLVAGSAVMADLLDLITRVADSTLPLVVVGETGVGKTMVARVIHAESERSEGPFVSVNCAALPEPLLESELFGHVRGAFTGATATREGLFADAHGGTLFLDERAAIGIGPGVRDRRHEARAPGEAAVRPRERPRARTRCILGTQGGCAHHRRHAPRPG